MHDEQAEGLVQIEQLGIEGLHASVLGVIEPGRVGVEEGGGGDTQREPPELGTRPPEQDAQMLSAEQKLQEDTEQGINSQVVGSATG